MKISERADENCNGMKRNIMCGGDDDRAASDAHAARGVHDARDAHDAIVKAEKEMMAYVTIGNMKYVLL